MMFLQRTQAKITNFRLNARCSTANPSRKASFKKSFVQKSFPEGKRVGTM